MSKSTVKSVSVRNLSNVKKVTVKKSTKVVAVSNRGRAQFAFVKAVADLPDGIMSVVYSAIKSAKRGSVQAISAIAISKFGLKKVTSQNPITQTHVMLNRLRALKAVKRIKTVAA
jgi:hypothetical protein